MSSKIAKLLPLAAIFALCIPSALAAKAQKSKTPQTKPAATQPAVAPAPKVLQVYPLKHAKARRIASTLRNVMGKAIRVADNEESSAILVLATKDQHASVQEILPLLDQPAKAARRKTMIFPSTSRTMNKILHTIFRDQGVRIALDPTSDSIIMQGTDEELKAAENIIEEIEKIANKPEEPQPQEKPQSFLLTFYFVKSGVEEQDDRTPLPKILERVEKALARSGLQNLSLMAPLSIRTQENSEFRALGSLWGDTKVEDEYPKVVVSVKGRVALQDFPNTAQLDIEAEIVGQKGPVLFSLETSTTVPLEEIVMFATAPVPRDQSFAQAQAIVMIVQVQVVP